MMMKTKNCYNVYTGTGTQVPVYRYGSDDTTTTTGKKKKRANFAVVVNMNTVSELFSNRNICCLNNILPVVEEVN